MLETRSKRKRLTAVLAVISVASVLAGCTKTAADLPKLNSIKGVVLDVFDAPPLSDKTPTADAMYQDGVNYFEKERYDRAISFFQKVRDEFPFSPEAEKAELKIADAFSLNKEYIEATEAYKNYLAFQPTSEHAPYIKYQLGVVHFVQFTRADRDQKNVKEAKRYFETLLKDHPESEHVPDAAEKLAKTREYLADREFSIGRFYLQERKYLAARSRYENVLRDYMDTPTAVKALYALGDAYRLEKNNVKATLAYEALIERYPESPYAEQARTYLANLKTEKYDPLASLLMQDGLPTGIDTSAAQFAGTRGGGGGSLGSDQDLGLVTKEEYEHEEINNPGLLSSLNPFSPESGKKDEGTEQQVAQESQESEKGFLSSLNPFSSSSDTESTEQVTGQEQTSGDTTNTLVNTIDTNLEAQGVPADTITPAPESDLTEVVQAKEEAPETDLTVLLSEVDKSLTQDGQVELPKTPELHQVFAEPLPPEPTEEEKLAVAENAKSASQTATASLLDSLDQTLEQKGIEQPDLVLPEEQPRETTAAGVERLKESVDLTPRLAKTTEAVELTPRLQSPAASPDQPLMLKQGEFALSTPEEKEEPVEVTQSGPQGTTVRALPDLVIKGVPEEPEVQAISQTRADPDWDQEQNPVEAMVDQANKASQALNPLSW